MTGTMEKKMRAMRLPLAVVAVALASACSGTSDDAGSAAAGDSVDVAAAPAAPPAARDPMGADTAWRLTEQGIGPVRVGMTVDELRAALGGEVRAEVLSDGGPDACGYAFSPALPAGVRVMTVGGKVARVEVDSGSVAAASGARIGDAQARVRELYAGRETRVQPHKYVAGSYVVVLPGAPADTLHRLVFETDSAGAVTRFRGGVFPPVEYVEGCS